MLLNRLNDLAEAMKALEGEKKKARDILATAAKNQTEDRPSTGRAAIRASI